MTEKRRRMLPIIFLAIFIVCFSAFFLLVILAPEEQTEKVPVSNEYVITSYNVSIDVNENNSYDVTENITANFLKKRHGLYRFLPEYQTIKVKENGKTYSKRYKVTYTNITCTENTKLLEEDGHTILKIGNPNQQVLGEQTYSITYTIKIGDDKIPDFDHFYYNIIGTDWDTTISNISFTVNFKKEISQTQAYIYIGEHGSNEETVIDIVDSSFTFTSNATLPAFSGITARVLLDEGYFQTKKASDLPDILILIFAILIFVVAALWAMTRKGKRIVPVVEFNAPEGTNPAEVGYIIDGRVDRKDVASLIVYWANKEFVKITDKGVKCTITKLKDPDETFKPYEQELFNAFFKKNTIDLNSANEDIAQKITETRKAITSENQKKVFKTGRTLLTYIFIGAIGLMHLILSSHLSEKLAMKSLDFFIIVLPACYIMGSIFLMLTNKRNYITSFQTNLALKIIGSLLLLGPTLYFSFVTFDMYSNPVMISIFVPLVGIATTLFMLRVPLRTDEGTKLFGSLIGLKQYIAATEKDRIKILAKENPSAFYDILPYAYVLGVSDIWIKKFEDLVLPTPEWYEGNSDIFVGYMILSAIGRTNNYYSRSIHQHRVSKKPSGSFGGGGGGFSGGGFGGGGGRAW